MALRDGVLTTTNNGGFSNLEIERDYKIIINCYNKKSSLVSSINFLMNIYHCCYIYKEANITTYCLAKKGICNIHSNIWRSILLKMLENLLLKIILKMLENLLLKIIVDLLLIVFVEFLI